MSPLLKTWEVAERLGVSTGTVLRWARAGQLPAIKLPSGAVRYERETLDRWLADRSMDVVEARSLSIVRSDHA